MARFAVLGAGSWGIAIAVLLDKNNHGVVLWEFDFNEAARLIKSRQHAEKLPGITIPERVTITTDLREAVSQAEVIVLAVPSQVVRQVARDLRPHCAGCWPQLVVNLAKGIENNTLCRMSQVLLQELGSDFDSKIAVLSGPSHAEEVSRFMPTTVVAAGTTTAAAEATQGLFNCSTFRVYTSQDLIGVELGGALKNIIAIAAGIAQGLGLGDNALGALITRGLAEMVRLGKKLGADPLTFSGLSGLGDLVTTCYSRYSRNRYVGEQLAKGRTLDEILRQMVMVAEGIRTTESAFQLSQIHHVDMPITRAVYEILFYGKKPSDALGELMSRTAKPEVWG